MSEPPRSPHPMSLRPRDRDGKRRKDPAVFADSDNRNKALFKQMQTERVQQDAKIAKLRGLRLAREEAEREAASQTAPQKKAAKKPASDSAG